MITRACIYVTFWYIRIMNNKPHRGHVTEKWMPASLAVPRDGVRVEVKDWDGNVGFAHAAWSAFTIHEGKVIHTLPQFDGWAIEANANLDCPVKEVAFWRASIFDRALAIVSPKAEAKAVAAIERAKAAGEPLVTGLRVIGNPGDNT